jgi:uncharacterized protein
MSQDNVRVVKELYEEFFQRDIKAILERVSPGFEARQTTAVPWGGTYRGAEGLVAFFGKLAGHLNNEALPIERYLDAGEHVVAIGRTQGTVKGNGKRFDVPLAHVWEVREGKAVSFRPFIDVPTMMACLD